MSWTDLDPQAAQQALADNPDLVALDVRTPPEYESHRIEGARLLPVQELQARVTELDPDASYLVICEHGMRSVAACQLLAAMGYEDLKNLRGGMAHWLHAGLPTASGPN